MHAAQLFLKIAVGFSEKVPAAQLFPELTVNLSKEKCLRRSPFLELNIRVMLKTRLRGRSLETRSSIFIKRACGGILFYQLGLAFAVKSAYGAVSGCSVTFI